MENVARPPTEQNAGHPMATFISYAINPLILPPITFGVVLAYAGATKGDIWWSVALVTLFFGVVPLLYLRKMVSAGEAETLEVRAQNRRTTPFLVGVGSYVVGLVVLWLLAGEARALAVGLGVIFPINTLLTVLINLRWKISVHVMSIAGFVATLACVRNLVEASSASTEIAMEVSLLFGAVSVPLVMWARVRSGAHSPGQVMAGAMFGFIVTSAEVLFLLAQFPSILDL